ncbi:MAG: pro-sigmaK processing inhibitor BofA family protein [Peptococcaceae bacterium]|nr:pro-sigmaK processing inhibitor BofA family protein [Peptococcaceae bacterium]
MGTTLIFLLVTLGLSILFIGALIFQPAKLMAKISLNTILGLVILWGLNFAGAYFNFNIPLNAFTVIVTGILGVPGIAMLGVLQFIVN